MRQKRKPIPREKEKTKSIRSIAPGKLFLLIVVPSVCLRWPFYPHYSFQQIFYLVFLFYQFFFMFLFHVSFSCFFSMFLFYRTPGQFLVCKFLGFQRASQSSRRKTRELGSKLYTNKLSRAGFLQFSVQFLLQSFRESYTPRRGNTRPGGS